MVVADEEEVLRRAQILFDQACNAKDRGRVDEAAELLEQAVSSVSSRLGEDNEHYRNLLTGVTVVFFENLKNKKPTKAKEYSKKFLRAQRARYSLPAKEPSDQLDQAWKLYDLGRFCQWTASDAEAYACFLQALVLGTEPGYTTEMDVSLGCLGFNRNGELSMMEGNIALAEQNLTVAHNAAQQVGDPVLQFITKSNVAKLCLLAGDKSRVKSFFNEALAQSRPPSEIDQTVIDSVDSYLTMRLVAKHLHLDKEAAQLLGIATAIVASPKAESAEYAALIYLVAIAQEENRDPTQSGRLHEVAFQLGTTTELRVNGLLGMARSEAAQNNWSKAEETFESALKLGNSISPQYEAFALTEYAKSLKQGKKRLLDAANMEAKAKLLLKNA